MNNIEEIYSHQVVQVLRVQAALEQSAMHAVNLAVARWSNNDVEFELARALPSSSRSRWHANAQDNFMGWLSAGGFAQHSEPDLCDASAIDDERAAPNTRESDCGCGCGCAV
jgi:hypothetical protein